MGPSHAHMDGTVPYSADLYADDAVFVEPRMGSRRIENVGSSGRACTFLLGLYRLNMTKMGEEGAWAP